MNREDDSRALEGRTCAHTKNEEQELTSRQQAGMNKEKREAFRNGFSYCEWIPPPRKKGVVRVPNLHLHLHRSSVPQYETRFGVS